MPRYFFHNEDGRCYPDDQGVELADIQAARRTALLVLSEMLRDHVDEFWKSEGWRVIATDHTGLVLFTLETTALLAPAHGRPRD